MTYVNKRTRLFLDRSDVKLERRRSEARLKTYLSAIDVRAWCDIVEDRRQHILELINKGNEKVRTIRSFIYLNNSTNYLFLKHFSVSEG